MNLTGNEDTDVAILLLLNLEDFKLFCKSNDKILNLCKNNMDLKYKMTMTNTKVNELMLLDKMTFTTDHPFPIFNHLICKQYCR